MLKNKKAVIFDMDGTLMDSMWMWKDIDIEYGYTETAIYFKERFQLPLTVEEIKSDWNRMACDKYEKQVRLKQGGDRFLHELKRQGVKLGIATSNHIDLAMTALRSNGVDQLFDCVLTSCDVDRGKPAPDVYLAVANTLKVEPKYRMVYWLGWARE